jgi:hypothetical protein
MLKSPSELSVNRAIAGLIYGQPGVGKTTLALSCPNPVLIDIDRGLHRVEKRFQVRSLQVSSYKEILDLLKSNELNPFDSIIFDTLGKLVDKIADHLMEVNPKNRQSDGALTMKGYGALKVEFQSLLRSAQARNKNLIFVAHEREEKDGESKIVRPDVSGSSGKDLVKDLDFMGYMEMKGNKRTISFTPCEKFYAKNSIKLPPVIEIPDTNKGNNFMQEVIVEGVVKRMQEDDSQNKKYGDLIKSLQALIDMVKDAETATSALTHINNEPAIWDSHLQAKHKLKEKVNAIGLVYNKESNSFESVKAA